MNPHHESPPPEHLKPHIWLAVLYSTTDYKDSQTEQKKTAAAAVATTTTTTTTAA
jgi:hypothetical protein